MQNIRKWPSISREITPLAVAEFIEEPTQHEASERTADEKTKDMIEKYIALAEKRSDGTDSKELVESALNGEIQKREPDTGNNVLIPPEREWLETQPASQEFNEIKKRVFESRINAFDLQSSVKTAHLYMENQMDKVMLNDSQGFTNNDDRDIIIAKLAYEILDEAVLISISTLCADLMNISFTSLETLNRSFLKSLTNFSDKNKRFLKMSGRLDVLRGALLDMETDSANIYANNHKNKHNDRDSFYDDSETHIYRARNKCFRRTQKLMTFPFIDNAGFDTTQKQWKPQIHAVISLNPPNYIHDSVTATVLHQTVELPHFKAISLQPCATVPLQLPSGSGDLTLIRTFSYNMNGLQLSLLFVGTNRSRVCVYKTPWNGEAPILIAYTNMKAVESTEKSDVIDIKSAPTDPTTFATLNRNGYISVYRFSLNADGNIEEEDTKQAVKLNTITRIYNYIFGIKSKTTSVLELNSLFKINKYDLTLSLPIVKSTAATTTASGTGGTVDAYSTQLDNTASNYNDDKPNNGNASSTNASNATKSKRNIEIDASVFPVSICFHPARTQSNQPTSVMVGTSGGDIVKFNMDYHITSAEQQLIVYPVNSHKKPLPAGTMDSTQTHKNAEKNSNKINNNIEKSGGIGPNSRSNSPTHNSPVRPKDRKTTNSSDVRDRKTSSSVTNSRDTSPTNRVILRRVSVQQPPQPGQPSPHVAAPKHASTAIVNMPSIPHTPLPFVNKEYIHNHDAPLGFVLTTGNTANLGNAVYRELFHYHKSEILLMEVLHDSSLSSLSLSDRLISLDTDGYCAVWKYSSDYFAGKFWFVPMIQVRLDLTIKAYKLSKPKVSPGTDGGGAAGGGAVSGESGDERANKSPRRKSTTQVTSNNNNNNNKKDNKDAKKSPRRKSTTDATRAATVSAISSSPGKGDNHKVDAKKKETKTTPRKPSVGTTGVSPAAIVDNSSKQEVAKPQTKTSALPLNSAAITVDSSSNAVVPTMPELVTAASEGEKTAYVAASEPTIVEPDAEASTTAAKETPSAATEPSPVKLKNDESVASPASKLSPRATEMLRRATIAGTLPQSPHSTQLGGSTTIDSPIASKGKDTTVSITPSEDELALLQCRSRFKHHTSHTLVEIFYPLFSSLENDYIQYRCKTVQKPPSRPLQQEPQKQTLLETQEVSNAASPLSLSKQPPAKLATQLTVASIMSHDSFSVWPGDSQRYPKKSPEPEPAPAPPVKKEVVVEDIVEKIWSYTRVQEVTVKLHIISTKLTQDGTDLVILLSSAPPTSSERGDASKSKTDKGKVKQKGKRQQSTVNSTASNNSNGTGNNNITYYLAVLHTVTMKFHTLYPSITIDTATDELLDYAFGPVMLETLTRVVFVLTRKDGVRGFSLETGFELRTTSFPFHPSRPSLSSTTAATSTPAATATSTGVKSFNPTRISVCPSQRVLTLYALDDVRVMVYVLKHSADGTTVLEQTPAAGSNSKTESESSLNDLTTPVELYQSQDIDVVLRTKAYLQAQAVATALDITVLPPEPPSMVSIEVSHIMDNILQKVFEKVEKHMENKAKSDLIASLYGSSTGLGHIAPTEWPVPEVEAVPNGDSSVGDSETESVQTETSNKGTEEDDDDKESLGFNSAREVFDSVESMLQGIVNQIVAADETAKAVEAEKMKLIVDSDNLPVVPQLDEIESEAIIMDLILNAVTLDKNSVMQTEEVGTTAVTAAAAHQAPEMISPAAETANSSSSFSPIKRFWEKSTAPAAPTTEAAVAQQQHQRQSSTMEGEGEREGEEEDLDAWALNLLTNQ